MNPDPHTGYGSASSISSESGSEFNPNPIRIQGFDDQKLKKKIKQKFFEIFFIKNCNLLMSKLFINFLCFWVIFAFLDPDPDTDPGTPLNPDPDPKRWFKTSYPQK